MKHVMVLIGLIVLPIIGFAQSGNAVFFDGNSGYGVRVVPTTSVTDITMEGWIKFHDLQSNGNIAFYYGSTGARGFGLFVQQDKMNYLAGGIVLATTNISIPVDEWHHWAITRNSSGTVRIYKDGIQVYSSVLSAGVVSGTDSLNIGGRWNTEYANAEFDEFRMWNVVRTQSEIASNRNSILSGDTPNLLVYYHFDEEDGALTAVDASPNTNDLTIHNGSFGISTALPVEFTSFSVSAQPNGASLKWSTATESNNAGFNVEKSPDKSTWKTIGFVAGKGTTTEAQNYSYIDSKITEKAFYRLKQLDNDGTSAYSNILSFEIMPSSFAVKANYPNPFNPTTAITYQLSAASHVKIVVSDVLGREVATILNQEKSAGTHTTNFDGKNLTSGLYFYSVTANGKSITKSMMLVK